MAPNPWTAKLSVSAIHPVSSGNVKAFVSVKIGDALTIHGCKVVQQPGQRAYVALPQNERNGKYFPAIESHDPRFQEALSIAVLAAWNETQS